MFGNFSQADHSEPIRTGIMPLFLSARVIYLLLTLSVRVRAFRLRKTLDHMKTKKGGG